MSIKELQKPAQSITAPILSGAFFRQHGFDYVGDERVNVRTATPMALLAAHLPTVNEALARVGGRPGLATGDPTLFPRADEVEEQWALVDSIVAAWSRDQPVFPNYPAGSWGPPEADELLRRAGREWREA